MKMSIDKADNGWIIRFQDGIIKGRHIVAVNSRDLARAIRQIADDYERALAKPVNLTAEEAP